MSSKLAPARHLDPEPPRSPAGRIVIPLGPRVIVKRTGAPEKIGSLYVPDNAKEKPSEGVVVAVGSGRILDNGKVIPADVRVGDVVMWGRFGGNEIKVDGEDVFSIHQDEILCRVEAAS